MSIFYEIFGKGGLKNDKETSVSFFGEFNHSDSYLRYGSKRRLLSSGYW